MNDQYNLSGDYRGANIYIQSSVDSGTLDMEAIKQAVRDAVEDLGNASALAVRDEEVFVQEVDRARDLLLDGNPVTARQIIESLSRLIAQTKVSNNLRFRIRTILGSCELELDSYQEAASILEDALQHAPDSPKARANVALAKLLRSDFESAATLARQVIEMDGGVEQTSAPAIYVQAVANLRGFDGIDDLLNESHLNNADYLRAMGSVFLRAKNYSKAEEMLRRVIATDEDDAHSLMMLAEVLSLRETEPLKGKVFISTLEDEELPAKLAEAEELLDRAVAVLQRRDNRKRLIDALANRAGIRVIRGDMQEAASDCEKVLAEDPAHVVALYNRAHVAHEQGDHKLAIKCLSAIPEDAWNSFGVWLHLARALLVLLCQNSERRNKNRTMDKSHSQQAAWRKHSAIAR